MNNQIKGIEPIRIQKGSGMIRFEFTNDNKAPIRLRLSAIPSLTEMKGKQASKGQSKYDFDQKINIDLTARELSMLSAQFDLFLDGRLPAFQNAAKTSRTEVSIYHDSGKHANMDNSSPKRSVEFEAKDPMNAFFRVKLLQGQKTITRVNMILGYFEIAYLRDMLKASALILQGLSQPSIHMVFKGNITESYKNEQNSNQHQRPPQAKNNGYQNSHYQNKPTMPIPS